MRVSGKRDFAAEGTAASSGEVQVLPRAVARYQPELPVSLQRQLAGRRAVCESGDLEASDRAEALAAGGGGGVDF